MYPATVWGMRQLRIGPLVHGQAYRTGSGVVPAWNQDASGENPRVCPFVYATPCIEQRAEPANRQTRNDP